MRKTNGTYKRTTSQTLFFFPFSTLDAYFENPNDWAFQRVQEERGGYKRDYGAPLDPKQVALTLVWGGGISAYIVYLVYSLGSGKWCGYVIFYRFLQ
jgi:hypothetical protein